MKQKLLNNFKLRATLLVAMLCVAFTGVRATDVTYKLTIDANDFNTTSYAANNNEKTSNAVCVTDNTKTFEVKWTSNQVMKNGSNVQWQKSKGCIYNSTNLGTITGVTVTSSAGSFTTYYGDEEQPSSSTTVGGGFFQIKVGGATGTASKIEVTFTVSEGGDTNLEESDLALTGAPVALVFDLYNNASAQVINYTTSSTGAVTVASSEYINAEVSNGTITVTPLKKTSDAVVITVNQAADDNYKTGSTTFTVNITDSTPKTGAWVLTSLADLGQGDVFVIVGNNGSNYAMSNDNGTSSAPTAVEVTIENDEITSDVDDNIKWNIGGNATDGYTFYPNGDSEIWLYCTSANNGVRVGTNDNKTFVIDSNYLKHSATSRYVGVYNSSDWRCYTNTTGNIANQTFAFYKYVDNTTPKVLSSITLSGEYPTSFHVGDAFSHEGMAVTATYDNASTKDVTASATFSGYDMAAVGNQTVTVSYTENEVTKTAEYSITVNAPATLTSITLSGTYPTEFEQGDAFSSEGIVVTANFDDNTTSDVTASATFSGYDMSVIGEQTVTVTYEDKSTTYTINVAEKKGVENNPYTVAEARAAIDAGTGVTGVYATGIVSAIVTAYNSTYGNISYNISADGSTNSDQLQAFRGKSYNGDWFTSADDIQVGDVVVVYGNLKKYSSTYEFDADNQLVSLNRPVASVEAPTFSPAAGTYADAQNVTISCETADATIYYTTDGTEPTNQSTEYTGSIAVNADMTIKAIAYDVTGANSTVATATYHICSADNPYTVTEALAFSEYPANGVYVSGIVSTAPTQSPTNNGQLTYYISVNGEATNQLQVYKGLGLNEAAFTAQDDIQVGDEVTIYGNVKIYNNTKEFDTGNYLVAFNRPATPTITVTSTSLTGFTYLVDNGPSAAQQITVGGENLTNSWSAYLDDYGNSNFEFSFTEDGEYFSDSGVGSMPEPNQNVLIYVRLKSGLPVGDYTGAITISSKGAETVTVNLSGSVAAALEAPVWSELPTETISVGEDYVLNLADYVSGSPVPAISIETGGDIAQFEDNILYFTPTEAGSFDFTFSASNSVGSAEATLTVTVTAPASIEVSATAINIPAATTTGYETIEVTYKNFTNQPTAHERFYDDDDNILTSNPATWIIVGTSDNNIFYQVKEENTSSEPRSVHFRIWVYDDNQQGVSSELITITQAGVVAPVTEDSYELYTGALTEGDYIIYYGEKAMNTTVSSDRLQYAEVTPENDVITTSDASIVWHIAQSGEYWTIYNVEANAYAAGTGAKNKAQMLDDGTDDKALWTVSGTETYEFVNKANAAANVNANLRNNGTYGFACYATGTGGALTLYKKATNTPSITITPDSYEMDAKAGGGELPVVSAYLADDPQLEVVFVEADGVTPANYDWISAEINNNGNIDGQITANTGDARTAYFYVQGVDADNNTVKSNLVTFTQKAAITEPYITVNTTEWNVDANGGSKTFGFDYENLGSNPTFEVRFFESDGVTETQCGWISYQFDANDNKVTINASYNDEGAARTEYFKVCAEVNKTMIYSNLVTVNQAAPVLDYATLPFSWDDTNTPNGITNNGVGTYKSSPYLKFDGTGDYIILKIDEVPGTLTFDIKGNGFSDGTFKVQTSEDGTNYTDLETYTDLDATTQSETFNLASSVRYIKWVYTEKVTGNVALGNIVVTAPMNLNLNAYGYATYASEYALDFTTAKAEGYSAWEITEVNYSTGTITFNQIKDKVAAGTGVLLMGDPSSEVTLTRTANGEALTDNKLVGITESTQVGDNQYFGLKGNEFVKVNTGVVPAGKALLPIDNPTAGVKSFTLIFNDADGIQTIETVSAEKAQAIFNLAGQRLPKAQKGINIINGKKVLVK